MGTTNPQSHAFQGPSLRLNWWSRTLSDHWFSFVFSVPFLLDGKEIKFFEKVGCTGFDFGRLFTTLFQLFQ